MPRQMPKTQKHCERSWTSRHKGEEIYTRKGQGKDSNTVAESSRRSGKPHRETTSQTTRQR
eukprot:12920391-Prorocentrum_lima.AAC.1